ncbi:hypothetical protein MKX03_011622 [Papaver bracteatum]|nr:hypothetical protein MKX03_011622 [Papaver bracteatum]
MEKPAAEKKHQFFSILHEEEEEEEEENRRLREGPESSTSEPLHSIFALKLRRTALRRESSRTFRLRNKMDCSCFLQGYVQKLETSRIVEPAEQHEQNRRLHIPCENSTRKKKSSSSQGKFASAGAIPSEVMSFSSPFPFFWTSMNSSSVGLRFRMTIPLKFAREHLLAEITNSDGVLDVLLQNEEGLSWEVLMRSEKLFEKLCHRQPAKNRQSVIFELIDRLPGSTFTMKFHICHISVPVQESNGPQEACFDFQRIPCENSTIKKEGSSSSKKSAAAGVVPREVRSFSSPFPFFWTSMKPSNVGVLSLFRMNIPVAFARKHLPTIKSGEEKIDVLLQNEEGCSYELLLCSRGFAKYYFSKGWKMFVMENKLNIGDCVLFELTGRLPAGGKLIMNFHIYQSPVLVEDDLGDE